MGTSEEFNRIVLTEEVLESYRNLIRILADTDEEVLLDDTELNGEDFTCVLCQTVVQWDGRPDGKYVTHADTCPYKLARELREEGKV